VCVCVCVYLFIVTFFATYCSDIHVIEVRWKHVVFFINLIFSLAVKEAWKNACCLTMYVLTTGCVRWQCSRVSVGLSVETGRHPREPTQYESPALRCRGNCFLCPKPQRNARCVILTTYYIN